MELDEPVRRPRCPHCDGRIHVYGREAQLLTVDEMASVRQQEHLDYVARLNAFRDERLPQWAEQQRASGNHLDIQILTRGDDACPACRELAGRVYSLDEVLGPGPLPRPECTTMLPNG